MPHKILKFALKNFEKNINLTGSTLGGKITFFRLLHVAPYIVWPSNIVMLSDLSELIKRTDSKEYFDNNFAQKINFVFFVCMSSRRGSNGSQYIDIPGSSPSLCRIAKIVVKFKHKHFWTIFYWIT